MLKLSCVIKEVHNVEKVARFEKISLEQYVKDAGVQAAADYDCIKLPRRATAHSAGYDFFAPADVFLPAGGSAVVKTGIRAFMKEGWALLIYPRSGLGFKLGIRLANTVGVIDGDYCFSDNEGHIMIKLVNGGESSVTLSGGTAIAQGIFTPYGITEDDTATATRNGGFGSTD